MITFQAIIDEARRQKNKLALDFYNLLKEIQAEHDNYRFDLVAYFEDEGSETVVGFGIDNWVENASFRTKHTRKELEKAEFGEVFDNPLFEVEEIKAKS